MCSPRISGLAIFIFHKAYVAYTPIAADLARDLIGPRDPNSSIIAVTVARMRVSYVVVVVVTSRP